MKFSGLAACLILSCVPVLRAQEPAVTLRNTFSCDLRSAEGREYRVLVSKPIGETPPEGHPVVYVLDGGDNFPVMAQLAARHGRYAKATGRDDGLIVVGIDYPDEDEAVRRNRRYYDFTPATPAENQPKHPKFKDPENTGGQDEFLRFLTEKVKPVIGSRFKVNSKRQAVWGHSLGGLMVLHTLFTRPEEFQVYLAVSPSIWWNGMSILAEEKSFVARGGAKVDLVLMAGGAESPHMAGDARHLAERLAPLNGNGLGVFHVEFPGEDHGTVVVPSLNRAMPFILESSPR
ncbi:MAG: alpha/beta hydrolase-fold protein [Luteolibacter sp.]